MAKILRVVISTFLFHCIGHGAGSDYEEDVPVHIEFPDESPLETIFSVVNVEAESLEHLPSIGNGHVATVVYSDTVFMNGLYNGRGGSSHRAKIPSRNNIKMKFSKNVQVNHHNLSLDVGKAVFLESWSLHLNGGDGGQQQVHVEQTTFAHRYYTKLIVTQIQVTFEQSNGNSFNDNSSTFQLSLSVSSNATSVDLMPPYIRGKFLKTALKETNFMCSEIQEKEKDDDPLVDKLILPSVCIISSHIPSTIRIPRNDTKTVMTFITGYGATVDEVESDFNAVAEMILAGKHEHILQLHVNAWQDIFWNGGEGGGPIQVEGNIKLAKVVNACFYYILTSLPSPPSSKSSTNSSSSYYGLSPSGLAYGSKGKDYQGHSFWDTEIWMLPPILYFYPQVAKQLLNYRLTRAQAARDHAKRTGYKGIRIPWEAASTGEEASPDNFSDGARFQVHITSDVSFAIRQYIAMTRDIGWLSERQDGQVINGCHLLREIAKFWISRAKYNESTGYYDIRNVMSPDEDHNHGDNNGFTNVGAAYSIFYAKYAECLCNETYSVPDTWVDIAKSLKLIYDKHRDYHPEYEGYQYGTPIKQADVILLGYPLLYDMPLKTRRNDIAAYTNVSRENGPAMTWSMHTIAFLETNQVEEAEKMFNQSYQWYMEEPFKMWSEWLPWRVPPSKYQPAVNFITGMGGFLQSIFNGYGGLRVYPEKIVMKQPRVVPGASGLVFRGVQYLGNVIDIKIAENFVSLTLRKRSIDFPLQISENENEPKSFTGGKVVFSTQGNAFSMEITTKTPTNCALPHDKIGVVFKAKANQPNNDVDTRRWWKKLKQRKYDFAFPRNQNNNHDCSVSMEMKPAIMRF